MVYYIQYIQHFVMLAEHSQQCQNSSHYGAYCNAKSLYKANYQITIRSNNMSLMLCPECRKTVSSKASTCPHCGYPLKKSSASNNSTRNLSAKQKAIDKENQYYGYQWLKPYGCSLLFISGWAVLASVVYLAGYSLDQSIIFAQHGFDLGLEIFLKILLLLATIGVLVAYTYFVGRKILRYFKLVRQKHQERLSAIRRQFGDD